jgi:alpha-glucuronidase
MAWSPDLPARTIAEEWTRLTFGGERHLVDTLTPMLLGSWRTYENYTGPFGLQTLTDIVGNHYGVSVEASENNGWGQWHRADEHGVGMDRTVATGTAFVGQYPATVRDMYESLDRCPDDLLLFVHHVPYTHRLHTGKTVIQSIYDSHYDGAEAVAGYARDWRTLETRVDAERYQAVLKQLEYQAGQAVVWRDAVSQWFLRESGTPDEAGRVEHYPGRIEAEAARLDGYQIVSVTPWEAASGGQAVECHAAKCDATFTYNGAAGGHDVVIQYFDVNTGAAHFRVRIGEKILADWVADDRLPTAKLDGSSSTRLVIRGVSLQKGDEIVVEGTPDGTETAALDYIEIR